MAQNMCFRAQYETWVAPPDLLRQHLKSLDTASEQEERGYEAKKSGYTKIGQENESYNKNIRCWTNLKERSGFAFSDTWKVCLIDK